MLITQCSPLGGALGAEAVGVEGGEGEAGAGMAGVSMAGVVPGASHCLAHRQLAEVLAQQMQLIRV